MVIQATSRTAYELAKRNLCHTRKKVFEALSILGEAHNQQIADYLGWPINCVTNRVLELRKMQPPLIVLDHISKSVAGRKVMVWRPADFRETLFEGN